MKSQISIHFWRTNYLGNNSNFVVSVKIIDDFVISAHYRQHCIDILDNLWYNISMLR